MVSFLCRLILLLISAYLIFSKSCPNVFVVLLQLLCRYCKKSCDEDMKNQSLFFFLLLVYLDVTFWLHFIIIQTVFYSKFTFAFYCVVGKGDDNSWGLLSFLFAIFVLFELHQIFCYQFWTLNQTRQLKENGW